MVTNEIATIKFSSFDPENEGIAVIRIVGKNIGICLSLKEGGDAEVIASPTECQELIQALRKAVEDVK